MTPMEMAMEMAISMDKVMTMSMTLGKVCADHPLRNGVLLSVLLKRALKR